MSPTGPIIVIDDETKSREKMRIALSAEGFGVLSAPTAARGLLLLRHVRPSLVLVDLCREGGMSGAELVHLGMLEGLLDPYRVVMMIERGERSTSAARWSIEKPIDIDLVRDIARDLCGAPRKVPAKAAPPPLFYPRHSVA